MEKKKSRVSLKNACILAINSFKKGEKFFARDVMHRVVRFRPEARYKLVETVMRECRRYCRDMYYCVDTRKGVYEKV